jgi:hypothetical protein
MDKPLTDRTKERSRCWVSWTFSFHPPAPSTLPLAQPVLRKLTSRSCFTQLGQWEAPPGGEEEEMGICFPDPTLPVWISSGWVPSLEATAKSVVCAPVAAVPGSHGLSRSRGWDWTPGCFTPLSLLPFLNMPPISCCDPGHHRQN